MPQSIPTKRRGSWGVYPPTLMCYYMRELLPGVLTSPYVWNFCHWDKRKPSSGEWPIVAIDTSEQHVLWGMWAEHSSKGSGLGSNRNPLTCWTSSDKLLSLSDPQVLPLWRGEQYHHETLWVVNEMITRVKCLAQCLIHRRPLIYGSVAIIVVFTCVKCLGKAWHWESQRVTADWDLS